MLDKMLKIINTKKWFFIGLLLIVIVVIIDQTTKIYAINSIEEIIRKTNGVHTHIKKTSFFNLVLVYNSGISFGMFSSLNFLHNFIFIVIAIISTYVMYLAWKSSKKTEVLFLMLIFGGAVGNMIDRAIYGAVVDFLDFHIKHLHWPAFNFADSCICIGVICYLISDFLIKKDKNDIK